MKRICFYHAGCPDGFGAAWAARTAWQTDGRYIPISHDDAIDADAYTNDLVVFVDIIPSNPVLVALGESAAQVIVLDHHLSSRNRYESDLATVNAMEAEGHAIHFDLDHSGAVLSWSHFQPEAQPPDLLRYVEDQDLWNWKLPRSQEVNAAIASYPMRFDVWDELASRPIKELAEEGTPIVRANREEVERTLGSAHTIQIDGRPVKALNSTHRRADLGHELARSAAHGEPWGCVYRVQGRRVHATLYSTGDFDVSTIAAGFGGGGHRNAAGFSVSLKRWLAEFCEA